MVAAGNLDEPTVRCRFGEHARTLEDRIVVRPSSGNEMTFECGNLFQPKPIDVEALLKINDRTQTQHLANKLVGAMAEACNAGIPTIIVERGKDGRSLVWYPVVGVAGYPAAPVVVPVTPVIVDD